MYYSFLTKVLGLFGHIQAEKCAYFEQGKTNFQSCYYRSN